MRCEVVKTIQRQSKQNMLGNIDSQFNSVKYKKCHLNSILYLCHYGQVHGAHRRLGKFRDNAVKICMVRLTSDYHKHKTDVLHWHNRPIFQPRDMCDSKYIPVFKKITYHLIETNCNEDMMDKGTDHEEKNSEEKGTLNVENCNFKMILPQS